MASLTGNQINNSYQGLLKSDNNGAISGLTNITDGLGNQTGLFLDPSANTVGISGSATLFNIKNTGLNKTTYPMGSVATQINFQDVNGLDIFDIGQDSYGSSYYTNINGDQGEQHIFRSRNQAGAITTSKISMNSYNNTNNSDNWFTGYNERITAGAYNSGTGDLTLTKPSGSDIVVNIPTGGGGGGTPAMTAITLPPIASRQNVGPSSPAAQRSYRGGEYQTNYPTIDLPVSTNSYWSVFPMAEGATISTLYFHLRVAASTPATTNAVMGIYELTTNTNGEVVMGDLLKDCGTIPATVGDKFVDISSAPFTMPSGSTFGAVGIIIGNQTVQGGAAPDTFSISGWQNGSFGQDGIWANGTNNIAAGTVYRANQRQYDGWAGNLPSNLNTTSGYDSTTGGPPVILIAS